MCDQVDLGHMHVWPLASLLLQDVHEVAIWPLHKFNSPHHLTGSHTSYADAMGDLC